MSFFTGEYDCKLDAKGRMLLPAKLKLRLSELSGNSLVINRGFEPCLVLYPHNEWKKVFDKVVSLNEFNKGYRNIQRNFMRGSTEADLDSVGRFLIPKSMQTYARLEKEVIAVGVGNRIELWNPEEYNKFLIDDQDEFSELVEKYLGDNLDENGELP